MLRLALALAAASAAVFLTAPGPSAVGAPAGASGCAGADSALERGQPAKARDAYMDVLAAEADSACAIAGLDAVTRALRAEERLCKEAATLAKGSDEQQLEARQRYAEALKQDAESSCAAKGLGITSDDASKDEKSALAQTEEDVGDLFSIAGKLLIALVVAIGIIALLVSLIKRKRNPSLAVEAFADGAVDAKVGAAVAALTAKRLTELSRRGGQRGDPYQLDVVVADVELVAKSEGLAAAMGGLAEESQFKLATAVLELIDRAVGTHLVAKGELAPKGGDGRGVLLSLESQGNGLQASGALWNKKTIVVPAGEKDTDPSPYYELADESASWVQFEAARALDEHVGLITTDAKSFTELVQGIKAQRASRPAAAADHYAEALRLDPENVAALINMSAIVAHYRREFRVALLLLIRAAEVFSRRYEELSS